MENDSVLITSRVFFDNKDHFLWYKFPLEYKEFIITGNLDAFLVGLLFLGLERKENIKIKGNVSEKLFYTIRHYLIPALASANSEYVKIDIFADNLNGNDLNKAAIAGTGLSCGIDSFATFYDHIDEKGSFKIDYFTFFNVGSHGDLGGSHARKIYESRLEGIRSFAAQVNKKLITVDSNLSEILKLNFQQSHSLRNISCALHLQKLFKNYFYASAYKLDHFKLNPKDTSDSDFLYLRFLDTESTSFYSSVAQYTRVERTLMVAGYSDTYNYLDVCTNPWENIDEINCSRCYKCLRTQLTLDIAGKLKNYEGVFDISLFKKIKARYIGELLFKKNKSPLDREVLDFMKERNYTIDPEVYFFGIYSLYRINKIIFKKNIKKLFGR
ncbi:hypothetical protein [Gramella sp. AN32]|uniref:Uncharacterized protein n=1 Tax=Christiangramia antarctica TaxID=2058158 RepID=A0ABW5X6S4_9FLAO|nr:hypothetical protein [Gramella sp. AN32]